MINLTDEERERFGLYCRQEAQQCDQLIAQMERIQAPQALIERQKLDRAALSVVATMLLTTETMTLGGRS